MATHVIAPNINSALITRRELAAMLRVSMPTIDRMDRDKRGPPRAQLSERRVGYRLEDVHAWLAKNIGGMCE